MRVTHILLSPFLMAKIFTSPGATRGKEYDTVLSHCILSCVCKRTSLCHDCKPRTELYCSAVAPILCRFFTYEQLRCQSDNENVKP